MQDAPTAVLYPPIDDDDEALDGDDNNNIVTNGSHDSQSLLTDTDGQIQAFERTKGWNMSRELSNHFDALKKRKSDGADVTDHHRALAARAARLAAAEVGRLRRAVAELEDRLLHHHHHPGGDADGDDDDEVEEAGYRPHPRPVPPEVVVVTAHHHEIPDRGSSDESNDGSGAEEGDPDDEATVGDHTDDSRGVDDDNDDELDRSHLAPVVGMASPAASTASL